MRLAAQAVLDVIKPIATSKSPSTLMLTSDDVWKKLEARKPKLPGRHDPRVIGALLRSAAFHKLIYASCQYKVSERKVAHGRPVRIWYVRLASEFDFESAVAAFLKTVEHGIRRRARPTTHAPVPPLPRPTPERCKHGFRARGVTWQCNRTPHGDSKHSYTYPTHNGNRVVWAD